MQYLLYTPSNAQRTQVLSELVRKDDSPLTPFLLQGAGPDNLHGGTFRYFGDRPHLAPHLAHNPDSQTWHQLPGSDVWLGTQKGNPVTPDALLRGTEPRFEGFPVKLNDGQPWVIPSALSLPTDFDLDSSGKLIEVPKATFRETYERTVAAWNIAEQALTGQTLPDYAQVVDYVTHLLAMNYRLTRDIAVKLKLLDQQTAWAALLQTLDRDRLTDLLSEQEKGGSVPDGDWSSTTSGDAD